MTKGTLQIVEKKMLFSISITESMNICERKRNIFCSLNHIIHKDNCRKILS